MSTMVPAAAAGRTLTPTESRDPLLWPEGRSVTDPRRLMRPAYLDLRVWLTSGSCEKFVQTDAEAAEQMIEQVHPERVFARRHLALSGSDFLTAFPADSIERIELRLYPVPVWPQHPAVEDIAAVSLETFRQLRRHQQPGGRNLAALAEMRSGAVSLLRIRLSEPPSERDARSSALEAGRFLSHLFTGPALFGRLDGGLFLLNPINIIRFAVSPAPAAAVPGALPARSVTGYGRGEREGSTLEDGDE